jgi:hypothetical protein
VRKETLNLAKWKVYEEKQNGREKGSFFIRKTAM